IRGVWLGPPARSCCPRRSRSRGSTSLPCRWLAEIPSPHPVAPRRASTRSTSCRRGSLVARSQELRGASARLSLLALVDREDREHGRGWEARDSETVTLGRRLVLPGNVGSPTLKCRCVLDAGGSGIYSAKHVSGSSFRCLVGGGCFRRRRVGLWWASG